MRRVLMLHHKINRKNISGVAFNEPKHEIAYKELIEIGLQINISILICNYLDFSNGNVEFAWTINRGIWELTNNTHYDALFDKCPNSDEIIDEIRNWINDKKIPALNHPKFTMFLQDKLNYSKKINNHIIETFPYDFHNIDLICRTFFNDDFVKNKFILKHRFSFGGQDIFLIDNKYLVENYKNLNNFIVQPFLETNNGIKELQIQGRHDLRIIIANGKIIQTYVRKTNENHFASNSKHGGVLHYFSPNNLPEFIKNFVKSIDEHFQLFYPRLYSIDVGIGKSGKIWIFELEAIPALHTPYPSKNIDFYRKQYRHFIIKELNKLFQ